MISLALMALACAPTQDPKPSEVFASWKFRPEEVKEGEVRDLRGFIWHKSFTLCKAYANIVVAGSVCAKSTLSL